MRPDFYVLCPSMELSGCVRIVICTVETIFRYLFLTVTVSGVFVTPFYAYKMEKDSCLWLLLSVCWQMWVNLFSVWFETYKTPFLLKSVSNLLVHWLLKSFLLYKLLVLCSGQCFALWGGRVAIQFSTLLCFRFSKMCLTYCNLIAGTNWFLKMLEVDGQKWSKTPDINIVIWACRTWFLGYG